jgi:predicted RNase H-like nuclease
MRGADVRIGTFIGLDGFRGGWVAATITARGRALSFIQTVSDLRTLSFDRAAIDCPIGLPDASERACDRAARALLSPHSSRVFTGARRGLWEHASHAAANAALKARGEAMVSIQLWNIGPKICEIDEFITPDLQARIIETHPELVFRRLNGGVPLPSKKSAEGIALRRALLRSSGFVEIDDWLSTGRRGSGAKVDDVLDACAAALAARDARDVLPRGAAPRDARGLAMQIWY